MVGARSHRTFNESLDFTTSPDEEEEQTDKVGHRSKRAEKANNQGQLPPNEHTGDPTQSASCYSFSSLDACGAYDAVRIKPGSQACTAFIRPFGAFQFKRMPFGLANAGSVDSRMLDVAMKKVDRDFCKSYLDDILTFSSEPWLI